MPLCIWVLTDPPLYVFASSNTVPVRINPTDVVYVFHSVSLTWVQMVSCILSAWLNYIITRVQQPCSTPCALFHDRRFLFDFLGDFVVRCNYEKGGEKKEKAHNLRQHKELIDVDMCPRRFRGRKMAVGIKHWEEIIHLCLWKRPGVHCTVSFECEALPSDLQPANTIALQADQTTPLWKGPPFMLYQCTPICTVESVCMYGCMDVCIHAYHIVCICL